MAYHLTNSNDNIPVNTQVVQSINNLTKKIEQDQLDVERKINGINSSSTIKIERHWYGTVDRESIENGFDTVYNDFSKCIQDIGKAINTANGNISQILELIKYLTLIDKDIYEKIDDINTSGNEFKSILNDWLTQQGVNDEDVRQLLETSFKRAYTLRDRINSLKLELKQELRQCTSRVDSIQIQCDNFDKKLNLVKKEITDKIQDYLKEISEIKSQTESILKNVKDVQTQVRTNANSYLTQIISEVNKFQQRLNEQNTLFDKHCKGIQTLSDTLSKTLSSDVGKFKEQLSNQTNDAVSSISVAETEFQGSVSLAISQFDENAKIRKKEIDKVVTDVQTLFKEQLVKQEESFQQELRKIKKLQRKKLVVCSSISIIISTGIASVMSMFF